MRANLASSLFVAAAFAATPGMGQAQDAATGLNGYFTLGSGSWSRGLSQNDGLSLQAGLDFQFQSGWFAGAWAANTDYAVEFWPEQPRDVAADIYGGYHARVAAWSWTVTAGRYFYPDTAVSYDYNEFSGTVGFRDRVFYSATYGPEFYGREGALLNQELSFALPLRGDLEIGAAIGHLRAAETSLNYSHWNVGISKLVRRVALDLRYYDSSFDRLTWLGDPNGDHWVLSMSYALRLPKKKI